MASRSGGMMALSFSLSLAAAPIMAAKTESPAAVRSASHSQGDFNAVRKAIAEILDLPGYDDGSLGPLFVRLAWHASGTYSSFDKTGGSGGGLMRFHPEATDPANNGLNIARDHLEKIKQKFPWISYGDLYTLAGVVAIEEMGGPKITWRPGRADQSSGDKSPKPGRLPDAARNADHIRAVFYRMGFNDREMVALIGAHALGRCHKERSGFDGPWTRAPTTFSNEFFKMLFDEKWTPRKWKGPPQFENQAKDLMMLPADLELIKDSEFRKYAEEYAKDEDKFFKDFAAAFSKLLELGVQFPSTPK